MANFESGQSVEEDEEITIIHASIVAPGRQVAITDGNVDDDEEIQTVYARVPFMGILIARSGMTSQIVEAPKSKIDVAPTMSAEEKAAATRYSVKRNGIISSMNKLWTETLANWQNFYNIQGIPEDVEECMKLMDLYKSRKLGHNEWEYFQNFIHLKMKIYSKFDALHHISMLPHRVLTHCLLNFIRAMYSNWFKNEDDEQGNERLWKYKTKELIKVIDSLIKIHTSPTTTVFTITMNV